MHKIILSQGLEQALTQLKLESANPIELDETKDLQFGEFASNLALQLFPQLDQLDKDRLQIRSPRDLAQAIANQFNSELKQGEQLTEMVEKVEVAGPGFINFYLRDMYFARQADFILESGQVELEQVDDLTPILVEYSSPNIAKPFTVGHLRSTIIGDATANLLEAKGYQVYRDNHLGDWGTQFGKQICAIKKWGDEAEIAQSDNPVKKLVELYVKFHQEAESKPELLEEARAWFKKLEDGDEEARRIWQNCINWSLVEFEKIYQKLGVEFTENQGLGFGESFFEDKMEAVVQELKEKRLLRDSEGAKLVFFPEEELPPLMIIKQDGATLYATRDLAADKFRLDTYGYDLKIINEVGSEQELYFRQLFRVEEMLG